MDALAPFRYPLFRRVWAAGFVSQLGDWMQIFARAALVYDLTGSPSSVGWVYFASYLPQMLFSLWGGVLADRFDRRRLLLWCQVAQLASALVLGMLVATEAATLLNVSVLSFLNGIAFMLNIPAAQALQPAVVPRSVLAAAITFGTASNSVTRVLGPVVAAALIGRVGIEWVFWINAVSFFSVIGAWLITRVPRQPPMEEGRSIDAMRNAGRYVARNGRVWVPITVSTFLASVGIVYQPLIIPYATEVLSGGASALGTDRAGWLQAAIGTGAAIGILGFASAGRRRPAATLLTSAFAFSVMLTLLGTTSSFALAMALCFALGAAQFTNVTLALSLVQHEVPEVMRGRVMSIHMAGLIGFVPIVSVAGGALADDLGIDWVFAGAGLVCGAFTLWALRWRHRVAPRLGEEAPEALAAVGAVLEEEG
jgi:MFS family permease